MIERGPATEDEVICAFLQAELNSDRWAPRRVNPALEVLGFDRSLIDVPNLNDPMENRRRKQVLTACGRGLPLDLTWRLVDLEASDFETMQYMADRNWIEFSNGERLVSVGARNFHRYSSDERFRGIVAITQAIRDGKRFPPLIAMQHHGRHLELIEGHFRATAYAMEGYAGLVEAFVGSSPSMKK